MAASVPVMKWMGPGLLASISIASTESLGVELTKRFAPGDDAQQETTSNHLSIATGIVALINQLRKHGFPGGLDCWSKGAVPWYLIALLAVWRARIHISGRVNGGARTAPVDATVPSGA